MNRRSLSRGWGNKFARRLRRSVERICPWIFYGGSVRPVPRPARRFLSMSVDGWRIAGRERARGRKGREGGLLGARKTLREMCKRCETKCRDSNRRGRSAARRVEPRKTNKKCSLTRSRPFSDREQSGGKQCPLPLQLPLYCFHLPAGAV